MKIYENGENMKKIGGNWRFLEVFGGKVWIYKEEREENGEKSQGKIGK